jgi:hypothetical protein
MLEQYDAKLELAQEQLEVKGTNDANQKADSLDIKIIE